MAAVLVARDHAVEQERVHVVVQSLVVQEQLGQETQISAPGALSAAVDLEEADEVVPVDLVSGWMPQLAFRPVSLVRLLAAEVREAELVHVHQVQVCELLRIRREVPRFDDVFSHLDLLEIAHQVQLRVVLDHAAACAELLDLFLRFQDLGDFFFGLRHVRHLHVLLCAADSADRAEDTVILAERRQGRARLSGEEACVPIGSDCIVLVLLSTCFRGHQPFSIVACF